MNEIKIFELTLKQKGDVYYSFVIHNVTYNKFSVVFQKNGESVDGELVPIKPYDKPEPAIRWAKVWITTVEN